MLTLSTYSGQVEEGQKPARKRICSRLLVGVGLGVMVLTVLSFFPGCGSDSTSIGSVKEKNAKPAGLKPQKSATGIPLLTTKKMDPDKLKYQKPPVPSVGS
jgi:hypothetical protein